MVTGGMVAQIHALPIDILFASPCANVMCHQATILVAGGQLVGIELYSVPLSCGRVEGLNVGSTPTDLQTKRIGTGVVLEQGSKVGLRDRSGRVTSARRELLSEFV